MAATAPTPLAALRLSASGTFPAPTEFSIRHWLSSAQSLLTGARQSWRLARQPGGDPELAEKAYVDFRKAAEVCQIILKHPKHSAMKENQPAEYNTYNDVRRELTATVELQKSITAFLEQREAAWNATHAPLSPTINGSGASKANGSVEASPVLSQDSVWSFIDAYSSQPPSVTASTSAATPPLGTPPSDAQPTMAQRFAALRNAGMDAAPVRPIRNSLPAAPAPPPPPLAPITRNETGGSSPTLQAPGSPTVPRKPEILKGRSPPGSPGRRAELPGLMEDKLGEERSGSAPPAIPHLPSRGRAGTANGSRPYGVNGSPAAEKENVGLALDMGDAEPVLDYERKERTAEWARRDRQHSVVSSPSEFEGQFPSLDVLERADYGAAPGKPPSKPPSPTFSRNPLPPPPKPFDLNALSSPPRPESPNLPPPAPKSATARQAPPPDSSTKSFNIPFTSEVLPQDLYSYLAMALGDPDRGPRVLMLDVRTREEFNAGRVLGDVVCIEPITARKGRTGYDLESSLSLSPPEELAMFSRRDQYDLVVIYDRASSAIPNYEPPSTASETQRVLWNLHDSIYTREFGKNPKRQPLLLKGGWDAWEKQVGAKGIVREGQELPRIAPKPLDLGRPRRDSEDVERSEAKRNNRKFSLVSGTSRNGEVIALSPTGISRQGDYFSPMSNYGSNSFSASGGLMSPRSNGFNAGGGLMSPPLTMPSPALQRPGPGQLYDYSLQSSSNRPSYPQPQINGLASSTNSPGGLPSALVPGGLPRTRSEFADLQQQSQQSYSYTHSPRQSIDYPALHPPHITQSTRPPPPIPHHHSPLPPVPLARPAAVQPAPLRSSSSFSGVSVSPFSTPNGNSSRFAPAINFSDEGIGLTGLKNLGNTCYMNSTIQCLSATIPFARYFKENGYKHDINTTNPLGTKGALANAVAELIRAIWAQNYLFLSPVTFRENICRWAPQFRGTEQHDAQEFLGFLLDGLHEDLNYIVSKPPPVEMSPARENDLETLPQQIMSEREWDIYRRRNDSFVVQCFQGQFRNQMRCLTCGKTSTTYNTFMPLSVPIPSGKGARVDLTACIASFVREEILDKDDAWNCPQCKVPRKASKKLTLSRLPPILVIHLKRFSFKGPFSDKIETQVQYPLSGLDLTGFMPPPLFDKRAPPLSAPPKGYVYDLYGVTNHYGNLSSGHYTAYVRNSNQWNSIGDSKVSPVDSSMVQSAKSAYILYFARR